MATNITRDFHTVYKNNIFTFEIQAQQVIAATKLVVITFIDYTMLSCSWGSHQGMIVIAQMKTFELKSTNLCGVSVEATALIHRIVALSRCTIGIWDLARDENSGSQPRTTALETPWTGQALSFGKFSWRLCCAQIWGQLTLRSKNICKYPLYPGVRTITASLSLQQFLMALF